MTDALSQTFDFESALVSHIGMKRKQNQDSGLIREDLGLFMVADGMGGHQGGETASRICVEKVAEFLSKNLTLANAAHRVDQALQTANRAIFDLSEKEPKLRGMGTTATILHISQNLAHIVQVGDSRIYYFNPNGIWQLTRDHSLVQEKLRAGLITRAQVRVDEMKNVITRSVGYEASVKTDLYQFPIQKGDGFLICSDGLSGPVDDPLIFEILEESKGSGLSLEDTAHQLVKSANARGGDDNVTVVLVKIN
jgi:serine/threonine protein phosphatase PrpC